MTGKGLTPPGIDYLSDNILTRHNIVGAPREARASWAKGLTFSQNTSTIFFAGCGYQYMGQLEKMMSLAAKLDASVVGADLPLRLAGIQKKLGVDGIFRRVIGGNNGSGAQPLVDAVRILQQFGIDFGYLGAEEPCCGGLLYYSGRHKDFAQNARRLYAELKDRGVRKIISIVPSCTATLRLLMPRFVEGFDIEILHFTEAVAGAITSRELHLAEPVKVTYHDPCQLSRYLGIVREPRQILKGIKGIELVEPEFASGQCSTCCGGGGGFEAVFPELSQIIAMNRCRELIETGADVIVTQCPGCILQIRHGLKQLGKDNIRVLDLAQVIASGI